VLRKNTTKFIARDCERRGEKIEEAPKKKDKFEKPRKEDHVFTENEDN